MIAYRTRKKLLKTHRQRLFFCSRLCVLVSLIIGQHLGKDAENRFLARNQSGFGSVRW